MLKILQFVSLAMHRFLLSFPLFFLLFSTCGKGQTQNQLLPVYSKLDLGLTNRGDSFYLSYSASELVFGINKQIFKYKVDNTAFKVKLGSSPFIINKGGNFNLDLYLFVFYKSVITFTEVQQLSRFTYSNLSGLETVINSTPKCDVIPPTTIQTNLDDKFKEMENRIVKLIENKNLKIEEQPKLEIKPLKLQSINENDKVIINNNNNIQHKPFYKWFF